MRGLPSPRGILRSLHRCLPPVAPRVLQMQRVQSTVMYAYERGSEGRGTHVLCAELLQEQLLFVNCCSSLNPARRPHVELHQPRRICRFYGQVAGRHMQRGAVSVPAVACWPVATMATLAMLPTVDCACISNPIHASTGYLLVIACRCYTQIVLHAIACWSCRKTLRSCQHATF